MSRFFSDEFNPSASGSGPVRFRVTWSRGGTVPAQVETEVLARPPQFVPGFVIFTYPEGEMDGESRAIPVGKIESLRWVAL